MIRRRSADDGVFQVRWGMEPSGLGGAGGAVAIPRTVLWLVLIAMVCTFSGQVAIGFDRPVNVLVGGLSGGLALCIAAVLWRTRGRAARH